MLKLDAINLILRSMGEHPVSSLDVQYPTLNIALPALDVATDTILSEGWWFNTRYKVSLLADINGVTTVPGNTLSFYPDNECITFEGTRFIWADTGNPLVNQTVCGRLVTSLDYDACPTTAKYTIAYQAAYDTYVADNGIDSTAQDLRNKLAGWASALSSMHTRSRKVSSFKRPTVSRWLNNLRG